MADAHRNALEQTLQNIAKDKAYENYQLEVEPVHTAGAGYTSQLYRAKISAPNQQDIKFFAKVATLNAEARSKLPAPIYFTEQYTYKRLAGIFKKIEDKHEVAPQYRFVFPIIYGYGETNLEEVIVMQDLAAEGYTMQDRFTSYNWEYASAAVQQIARFHALSIAMRHDFPEDYREVVETYRFNNSDIKPMTDGVRQSAVKSIELTKEEHRERLHKYLDDYMEKAVATYYDVPKIPVINHGDLKMSNIMHKEREDGSIEPVLIDYQILHVASSVKDLMYFIFTGSDAAFRRRYYHQLLEHYYKEMTLHLARLNLNPEETFPREEFDADLKENGHLGLLFALHALPVVTVAEAAAPAPGGTLAHDTFLGMDASQLCRDRLDEVAEDYIRWGLI